MLSQVIISRKANKQLKKVPDYIKEKLEDWAKNIQTFGIQAVRQHKGYHDEPLIRKAKR